jgi:hypothetical protein
MFDTGSVPAAGAGRSRKRSQWCSSGVTALTVEGSVPKPSGASIEATAFSTTERNNRVMTGPTDRQSTRVADRHDAVADVQFPATSTAARHEADAELDDESPEPVPFTDEARAVTLDGSTGAQVQQVSTASRA